MIVATNKNKKNKNDTNEGNNLLVILFILSENNNGAMRHFRKGKQNQGQVQVQGRDIVSRGHKTTLPHIFYFTLPSCYKI